MGFFDKMKNLTDKAGKFFNDDEEENVSARDYKWLSDEQKQDLKDQNLGRVHTYDMSMFAAARRSSERQYAEHPAHSTQSPTPVATGSETTSSSQTGLYSARINRLIAAAVADGEITESERRVLLKAAAEEGVDADEFDMVLESKLFEQKKVLQAQEDARRNAAAMAAKPVAVPPSPPQATAKPANSAKPTRCPHCGAPIETFASQCPECGVDYNMEVKGNYSPWEQLVAKLNEVEENHSTPGIFRSMGLSNIVEKKTQIIQTFPIPSDKQGITEFFIALAPLTKGGMFSNITAEHLKLIPSYKAKAKQILLKARLILRDDPSLLEEIESVAKKYKIKT